MKRRFLAVLPVITLVLAAACENVNVYPSAPDVKADTAVQVTMVDPVNNRNGLHPGTYDHNTIMVVAPAGYILPSVQTTLEGNAIQITQVDPMNMDIVDCAAPCNRTSWRIDIYYYVNDLGPDEQDRHSKVTVTLQGVPDQKVAFEVWSTNKG